MRCMGNQLVASHCYVVEGSSLNKLEIFFTYGKVTEEVAFQAATNLPIADLRTLIVVHETQNFTTSSVMVYFTLQGRWQWYGHGSTGF